MIYPSPDKLEATGSRFGLVTVAAKRAKQIKNGANPLIDTDAPNPLTIALEEVAAGKVKFVVPDIDEQVRNIDEHDISGLFSISAFSADESIHEDTGETDDWALEEDEEPVVGLDEDDSERVIAVDELLADETGDRRSIITTDDEDEDNVDIDEEEVSIIEDTEIDGNWSEDEEAADEEEE